MFNKINANLNHRISNTDATVGGLTDTITTFTDMTRGILYGIMLSAENGISPKDTANAAFAAIHNLDDIDAYLKAFVAAQKQ